MNVLKNKLVIVLAVLLVIGGAFAAGSGMHLTTSSTSAAPTLYNQDTTTSIYTNASPAIVEIDVTSTTNSVFGNSVTQGLGTGFLIDTQGHILTNNHVVDGATSVQVVLNNGNTVDGTVLGTDPVDDLAVVSIDASSVAGITPLTLGDSSKVVIGQMAIAIGNPLGFTDSMTVGIISGLNRSIPSSNMRGMIQTDAAINPGNSGGPLFDSSGNVIGINTAAEIGATGADGMGFAIPSNLAAKILPALIAGQTVDRPWLGIAGTALTSATAKSLNLSVSKGVYVVGITTGSPVEKAGLKAGSTNSDGTLAAGGDVITAVDGKAVASVEDLSAYISTKSVGDTVTLTILRGGQTISVKVTLAAWPADLTSGSVTPQVPTTTPALPRNGR
jgi:S1-C subfamily serine protease